MSETNPEVVTGDGWYAQGLISNITDDGGSGNYDHPAWYVSNSNQAGYIHQAPGGYRNLLNYSGGEAICFGGRLHGNQIHTLKWNFGLGSSNIALQVAESPGALARLQFEWWAYDDGVRVETPWQIVDSSSNVTRLTSTQVTNTVPSPNGVKPKTYRQWQTVSIDLNITGPGDWGDMGAAFVFVSYADGPSAASPYMDDRDRTELHFLPPDPSQVQTAGHSYIRFPVLTWPLAQAVAPKLVTRMVDADSRY